MSVKDVRIHGGTKLPMSSEPGVFRRRIGAISMANQLKAATFPQKNVLRDAGSLLDQMILGCGSPNSKRPLPSIANNDSKYQINKDRAEKYARDTGAQLRWAIAKDIASSEALQAQTCDKERKIKCLGYIPISCDCICVYVSVCVCVCLCAFDFVLECWECHLNLC